MLGPGPIGKLTFVASTTSSMFASSRSARPVTSSLTPSEYMSAVSKKLIPASTAARKKGRAAASSSTHGRHPGSP
jgi:ribosomal protein S20